MDAIELLAKLGLPSAIVAMVIISYIFKDKFEKLTKISLGIAIGLAALFGIIQIVAWTSGKDVALKYSPTEFYALSRAGEPVELNVFVKKSGNTIKADTIASIDPESFENRIIVLDSTTGEKFALLYEGHQQGTLSYEELRSNGWRQAFDLGPGDQQANYWFTHKVYVGDPAPLGKTSDAGDLEIRLKAIRDNQAIVTLALKGGGRPKPPEVGIENKKIGIQDFSGIPTFYIAVREANFKEQWAAFSVFQYRGY
ncbi:hypothetical protein EH223_20125 [candidate division KSB1 bacterium]|nr:hypothetical protein [candidate division KSB1 bacterium]RQW00021.1 MAG: hypothetical protein EH223_20125 [candidate division KSB1 bacterium]